MKSAARAAATLGALAAMVWCGGQALASTDAGSRGRPASADSELRMHAASVPDGDWDRFDDDAQRSGVGPTATGIDAHNLSQLKLRQVHLDGTVDSSPIQLHAVKVRGRVRDVVVLTTSYGRTIALDPATGQKLWEFVPADIRTYQGTGQITASTPIADPGRSYVYAASPDGRIHKLAVATGREVRSGGWPVRVTLNPAREKIAAALNISGSSLVVTTGGYIPDVPPYQGHVVMVNLLTGRITAVWNSLCSRRHRLIVPSSCPASDSAMWARSGAVIEPATGRILVATGNGPFNGSTNWGDSVLELSPDAHRLLHNWTPTNQAYLDDSDLDLGSTAPALLPPYHGFHLAVQGGKEWVLDLLDLDRLNGTRDGPGPRLGGQLQELPAPGHGQMVTAPVVWTHAGHVYVFLAQLAATAAYELEGGRHPRLHLLWENGSPGTSPVLAGGLLYVYDQYGALDIYQPTTGKRLVSLPVGTGHWNSPIVLGGRVILPLGSDNDHLTTGTLDIFHLPNR